MKGLTNLRFVCCWLLAAMVLCTACCRCPCAPRQAPATCGKGPPPVIHFSTRQYLDNTLVYTNRTLDIGIAGEGYFKVHTYAELLDEQSTVHAVERAGYTRSGRFNVDGQRYLVIDTPEQYRLDPPIEFPMGAVGDLIVKSDGMILAEFQKGQYYEIAQLALHRFPGTGLLRVGEDLYVESEASGAPWEGSPGDFGFGSLAQGYLESRFTDKDD